MANKLTGKALAKFEAERDVWQEVLDGVRENKAGGGRRRKVEAKSHIVRVRLKSGLSQWVQNYTPITQIAMDWINFDVRLPRSMVLI